LARRGVAVAEAAHGLDRHAVGGLRVELPAEVADVELHLVAADAVRVAPDELEQLIAAEHLTGVADEGREQAELERRELHLALADVEAALAPCDRQVRVSMPLLLLVRGGLGRTPE